LTSLPPPPPALVGGSFEGSLSKDEFGGFWRRVLASFIDSVATGVVISLIAVGLALAAHESVIGALSGDGRSSGIDAVVNLVSFLGGWLYSALMESSRKQATLGKMALSISVTDLDGRRISFGRATGRYFAKILSAIILLIGFIMVAFTARRQGLHDMIADTLVVKNDSLPADRRPT
jgi:uncharacterized RDD family membrane protein YckC